MKKPKFTMAFSKEEQIGHKKIKMYRRDIYFRYLLIAITRMYVEDVMGIVLPQGRCMCIATGRMLEYSSLAVSHIKKRSTHPDLHYDIRNVQLIGHDIHEQQEAREIPEDLRPKAFIKYINTHFKGATIDEYDR